MPRLFVHIYISYRFFAYVWIFVHANWRICGLGWFEFNERPICVLGSLDFCMKLKIFNTFHAVIFIFVNLWECRAVTGDRRILFMAWNVFYIKNWDSYLASFTRMDSIMKTAGFIATYSAQYCCTVKFWNNNNTKNQYDVIQKLRHVSFFNEKRSRWPFYYDTII